MNKMKEILLIDDDSKNIFALNAVLKAKNYKCVSVTSATEGFKILEENNNIAVVLMDMMMPEMDGYQAIQKLKSDDRFKHLPVISITAQAMPGDREKCLEAGADAYISKPVNLDELLPILNHVLS